MRGLRRTSIVIITLPVLLCAVLCTQAQASPKRIAPFGLFGAVLDPLETDPGSVSNATLDAQMGLMARSGVESLRVTFDWGQVEPLPNMYDWSNTDRIVADAAKHGLTLLPDLIYTPTWASTRPNSAVAYRYQPTSPALFAQFATALAQRYGPGGTFWKLNPRLPRDPVSEWQIWNEEGFNIFWASSPWPATYTKLLKAGYTAIRRVDRHALVVPGSLADVGPQTQWAEMSSLYRAGAGRYFNVVSVHPFTINANSVSDTITLMLKIVSNVRAVMRRHGDARTPLILTEMTWPGAVGIVPKKRLLGLETTPSGERRRLAAAYAYLSRHWRQTGITQAYWYTWASTFDRNDPQSDISYDFSGLTRYSNGSFFHEPTLTTYANTAARFEGCRKTENARKCR
jgi:hypothetical protein